MPETNDISDGPGGTSSDASSPLRAPASPAQPGESVEALRARVAALETENAELLDRYASRLQGENQRMRRMLIPSAAADRPVVVSTELDIPSPSSGSVTAVRLARDLAAIEQHLADMEAQAAMGDAHAAALAKVAAANRACSTLRRVCEDADFRQLLLAMSQGESLVQQLGVTSAREMKISESHTFWETEVALLELIGLSRAIAERHVDLGIEAFDAVPVRQRSALLDPAVVLDHLRALRDATCETADIVALGVMRDSSRARWRKILTYGIGGTVIVAANGLAATLLGPVGLAVSQAVGSAAIGVAAPLVA